MNTRNVITAALALTLTAGSALAQQAAEPTEQWSEARLSSQAEAVVLPGVGAVSAGAIVGIGAGVLAVGAFISAVTSDSDGDGDSAVGTTVTN